MTNALMVHPDSTAYMFGVSGFYDGPCAGSYDPYAHAEALGVPLVSNMTLDDDTPASYSHQLGVIFFRADFPEDVERCAIAHEIVHYEYNDDGKSRHQEDRADRIATLRLIRPSRLARIMRETNDYAEAARELRVTEKTMRLYLRMARNGTLPRTR